jgi:hypothetical protein
MFRLSIGTAAVAAVALAGSVLAPPSSEAADDYAMTATFGVNEHSKIPVDLTLPAPGDGRRVDTVRFGWMQTTPTYQGSSSGSFVVETPQCVADAECQVHAVVPTGRMKNSAITWVGIGAYDGTTKIGSTSKTLPISNPKPTVAFTAPSSAAVWNEQVTLAADATPSSSGAAIKAVRFYVNPRAEEDFPFLEDTEAPYAVTIHSSEIAESTRSGTLYAVAEDVEGNLSQYGNESYRPYIRTARVGPPPIVSWRVPAVDGRPAGGMSTRALLEWDTALPETAPPNETNPDWPYIERIEVFRDGVLLLDKRWDESPSYGFDFGGRKQVRTVAHYLEWMATSGMTPGEHDVTLRVTTSYGSVGTATRRFVVTDGVTLGSVMSGDRVVQDGHIVTAGRSVPLRFTVAGKVRGSAVTYYAILQDEEPVIDSSSDCGLDLWWNCPEQVTVRADWSVPSTPGTYTLRFVGQERFDAAATTTTRTIRVQPAGAVRAGVSSSSVRIGRAVAVRGRVVRTDTDQGMRGIPVTLQWRKAGTARWTTVVTRTSGLGGKVRALPVRRSTGFYRWVSPGVLGKLGPSRSKALKVVVRR